MLSLRITLNTTEYGRMAWPERVAHLKRFGFTAFEVGTMPEKPLQDVRKLKKLLKNAGIAVAATHDWYHFFSPDDKSCMEEYERRFIANIERTIELDCDRLVWYTGENTSYPGEKGVGPLLDRLEPVLAKAETLGVQLMLETEFSDHGTDVAGTVAVLETLMRKANHKFLKVNFDAGNIYTAGEEAFPYAYRRLKEWIAHVHVKDVGLYDPSVHAEPCHKQKAHTSWGREVTAIPCPPGEGAINWDSLMRSFLRDGYKGHFSLEPHMDVSQLDGAISKGCEFLTRHLS